VIFGLCNSSTAYNKAKEGMAMKIKIIVGIIVQINSKLV